MKKTLYQEESGGVVYERNSYTHGGGWYSNENGIQPGTIREINGVLSKAWMIYPRRFRKDRVHWISVSPNALREVDIAERP